MAQWTALTALMAIAATALWSPDATAAEGSKPAWDYEGSDGPSGWAKLSPEFAACGTGRHQSPIDLVEAEKPSSPLSIAINYKPLPLTILHNGHTVEVVVENGSTMTLDGKTFDLLQFHFHTPSEHTVGGKRFDAEVHFVHRSADGQLAVIGVFVADGAENPALAEVIAHTPPQKTAAHTFAEAVINPRDILPSLTEFWIYDGSLTTPPCTEGVRWMVERVTAPMSQQHIDILSKAMGDNARPIQPINDRHVVTPK